MEAQANSKQTTTKKSVELAPDEAAFVKERREKAEAERVPIADMEQKGHLLLNNVTIDTVYEAIYSDKPFKFKGKEEPCYMAFVLKKTGGSNYRTTPYEPPGPKFYTSEEGRTFNNTPLIS
jgi:hypothetical protein